MFFFFSPGENVENSQPVANENSPSADTQNPQEQTEKKLRALKKKLQQIEKLKSKQDEGEVLEDSQVMWNDLSLVKTLELRASLHALMPRRRVHVFSEHRILLYC